MADSSAAAQPDFELEFYKLHRAHEVTLNNATATYEQSTLRLVLLLNAASIGTFLSLMNIGKESLITYDVSKAKSALVCWAVGIAFAFMATAGGYWSQRAFTQAYNNRRRAVEARKITNEMDNSDIDKLKASLAKVGINLLNGEQTADEVSRRIIERANNNRQSGAHWENLSIVCGFIAAIMASIGYFVAIRAVYPSIIPDIDFQSAAFFLTLAGIAVLIFVLEAVRTYLQQRGITDHEAIDRLEHRLKEDHTELQNALRTVHIELQNFDTRLSAVHTGLQNLDTRLSVFEHQLQLKAGGGGETRTTNASQRGL